MSLGGTDVHPPPARAAWLMFCRAESVGHTAARNDWAATSACSLVFAAVVTLGVTVTVDGSAVPEHADIKTATTSALPAMLFMVPPNDAAIGFGVACWRIAAASAVVPA